MAGPKVKDPVFVSETASATDETSLLGGTAVDDEDTSWLQEQRLRYKALPWFLRPSVAMMGFMVFMIAFAGGASQATTQMIQFRLACNSLLQGPGPDTCDPAETQLLVLSLQQAFSVARGISTIIALGKVGPLSDKYGRKIFIVGVLLFLVTASVASYFVMSVYPTLHFGTLVTIEFLGNLAGGAMSLLVLANCYISDIADPSKRTYYFGLNFAFLFVGMSIGPLFGNYLVERSKDHFLQPSLLVPAVYGPGLTRSDFAPLKFEILLYLVVLVFATFVLPESRGEHARKMSRSQSTTTLLLALQAVDSSRWKQVWDFVNFVRPMRLILYPKDSVPKLRHRNIVRTRIAVILLIMTDCVTMAISGGIGEVYILYGIYQYGWTTVDLGHVMAVMCASKAIVLVVISPMLTQGVFQKLLRLVPNTRRFDTIDYGLVMVGFVAETFGQFFMSTASTSLLFVTCLAINALASIGMPAIQASVVKFYPESKTGELFGGMGIAKNICAIVAPAAVLALYKTAVSTWHSPHVVFLIFSGFFAMAALTMTFVIVTLNQTDADAVEEEDI